MILVIPFRKFVRPLASLSLLCAMLGCSEGAQKERASASDSAGLPQKATPVKSAEVDEVSVDTSAVDDSLWAGDVRDSISFDDPATAEGGDMESDEDLNTDFAADPELSADGTYMDEESTGYVNLTDGEMDVETDRLVATVLVRVFRPDFADQRDSALAEVERRLSITPERIPATVVVEKWISPVNFEGYKFNQRKLILFGVQEEQRVTLYYYVDQYYFALDERFYELDQALAFEPFLNLVDTALVRHLSAYENSL